MPAKVTDEDTICAISTPVGEAGIGIVRLSGPKAVSMVARFFRPRRGRPGGGADRTMTYGHVVQDGEVIDEVLVSVMKAPRSYTREDVVEINCHGGMVALHAVLSEAIAAGARLAEPGEFTRRAFLNGRIDLAQAEAVADVIRTKTTEGLRTATATLRGRLSEEIGCLRDELVGLCAVVEASIDFPEEELPEVTRTEYLDRLERCVQHVQRLVENADSGRLYREGIAAAIVGRPNVGKSSVLNALLRQPRAIVTPVPGTTRDIIEEVINLKGVPLRLIDTAGIRPTEHEVEKIGVSLSVESLEGAQIIFLVVDSSEPLNDEDEALIELVRTRQTIVVLNKIDLDSKVDLSRLGEMLPDKLFVRVSALEGMGIDDLKEAAFRRILEGKVCSPEQVVVSNVRHQQSLIGAESALRRAIEDMGSNMSLEFVSIDLREALDNLGEIVGVVTTEDLLDRIFEQFCIGK